MQGLINKSKWHLVVAFLVAMSSSLSANTRQLILNEKVNPRDGTLVVRNTIAAGGVVDILQGYKARQRGQNDFDGNELTSDRNFIIDGLTINYGVAPTADNTPVESAAYTTALPPALQTANLVIKQQDNVIRRISIAAINKAKSTDEGWYYLDSFALLRDQRVTSIEVEFAGGTNLNPPANNTSYIEVMLKGFETNVKF